MSRFITPRVFSTEGINPYNQLDWKTVDTSITDDGGKVIFEQKEVEVPASWSALAVKIAVSKYFYGDVTKGRNPRTGGRETSIQQLIDRVVQTITKWGFDDGYFQDEDSAWVFAQELTWLLVNQYGAFNSPVWFNVGLCQTYGIGLNGGPGNWVYDPRTGKAIRATSQYVNPQASACFILSVEDTMESILDLAKSEAMLFKYGSGAGTDLSTLRSTRDRLSNGGKVQHVGDERRMASRVELQRIITACHLQLLYFSPEAMQERLELLRDLKNDDLAAAAKKAKRRRPKAGQTEVSK